MRSSIVRAMAYQCTTKFLPSSRWFLGSFQFINGKFGYQTLQEPESRGIVGSGTDRLPLALFRVGLVNEAQLGHKLCELVKTGLDPKGDKADHILVVPTTEIDPICWSPLESDSEGDKEVYMVGNGEELLDKSFEEAQRDTNIDHVARLAREVERGKRQNGMHEDLGVSEDEPRDGALMREHHPKFNLWRPEDRD
jgi:hypothetical protein